MTVAELIQRLQQCPQEAVVVIDDADTQWLLLLSDVDILPGVRPLVALGGGYHQTVEKP